MDLIILTGMSGAGKSQAAAYFEDHGYFCIDNLPPIFLPRMAYTFMGKEDDSTSSIAVDKLCLVVDIRSRDLTVGFEEAIKKLDEMGCTYRIVFLEAAENVLVSRYRQTRRKHPLMDEMSLVDAISMEKNMLRNIRGRATHIIDTTMMPISALRKELRVVIDEGEASGLSIFVQSFGFMYGTPTDSDDVIDVRFLPNPFWVEKLKMMSGLDEPIGEYLKDFSETGEFLEKYMSLLEFMIPFYVREGKSRLNLGVGCTGGRHRSVFIAEEICRRLKADGFNAIVHHRDIDRDPRYEKPKSKEQ